MKVHVSCKIQVFARGNDQFLHSSRKLTIVSRNQWKFHHFHSKRGFYMKIIFHIKVNFSAKTEFCENSMKFTKCPVSGTSKTIDIPQGILMISRPDRKRVYFYLNFMKFSEVPPLSWKYALSRPKREIRTSDAFLVTLSKSL